MDYINEYYGVSFKIGDKVIYSGDNNPIEGEILGCRNAHLKIKTVDGKIGFYHPTWELKKKG